MTVAVCDKCGQAIDISGHERNEFECCGRIMRREEETTVSYVVIENTPGYLPEDDDPATFDNEGDARVYASGLLSRLLDSICDGDEDGWENAYAALSIVGSFQSDTCVYVTDTRREHDLGRVIEIIEDRS